MRIYLADLFHVETFALNPVSSFYTVPLGIGYLKSTLNRRIPGMDVRLFRDPDRLFKAIQEEPPHLLGLSFTSWNMDISNRAARLAKRWSPKTQIVGGGPCVDEQDEQLRTFFAQRPEMDYLIPNEGENGFVALVSHLEKGGHKDGPIPGVAYMDSNGQLIRGTYRIPEIVPAESLARPNAKMVSRLASPPTPGSLGLESEIPSPYLDGTLDSFLEEGLVPIIQTMRGCPYRCEFCVSGNTLWNKPRGFLLERVEAEIDYALSRSDSKALILTDENWGILGERDIEIARFIKHRHDTLANPTKLYYYTAKIVNDASREIVEMVAPLSWIAEFSISFQSMNPETRKAIKRTNISLDKLEFNVHWANERSIQTTSEMIFGFPHETVDSFLDGIETLYDAGMDKVLIYPLQLFPGIEIASETARKEYGFITRFRAADNAYGRYMNGELISVESEEVVVGTKWCGEDGYFQVRRYSFFQQILLVREYFKEFFVLAKKADIPVTRLIRFLAMSDYSMHPVLHEIMRCYGCDVREELKLTHEDVVKAVADQVKKHGQVAGVKINLVYLGKIFSSYAAVQELLDLIDHYICSTAGNNSYIEVVQAYLHDVLPNRIVILDRTVDERVTFKTQFDYNRWLSGEYQSLNELLSPVPLQFEMVTADVLKANLIDFENTDSASLQGIFDKTRNDKLMRTISELAT